MFVLLLLALFLFPGVLGHAPWKQDETYTFGIIHHFLTTREWLIPINAGEPFMEKPPLYFWVASAFAQAFSTLLPLHDGARLASVFFGALTFIFAARAARAAFSTTPHAWWGRPDLQVGGTLALMAGTLLLIKHVHDLFSDVALLAGAAIALSGLIRIVVAMQAKIATEQGASASAGDHNLAALSAAAHDANKHGIAFPDKLALGVGVRISLMSKGVFIPGVFGLTTLLFPLLARACRRAAYWRAVFHAVLISLPFLLIWPALLYLNAPALFDVWFWDNNVGRFLGFSVAQLGAENEPYYILKSLFSTGFPVVHLALLGLLFGSWRQLRRDPAQRLCWLFLLIGVTVLSLSATARQLYLLPFVLPGALLAAGAVLRLPSWLMSAWDASSRLVFGTVAICVWLLWWQMLQTPHTDDTHRVPELLGRWLPLDYVLPFQPLMFAAGLLLTGLWSMLLPFLHQLGKWRGVFSWTAGLTLCWGLVFTLLLPWIDHAKSYSSVFTSLRNTLGDSWTAGNCMASIHLGESEAPMLYYVARILHEPLDRAQQVGSGSERGAPTGKSIATRCKWLIVQGRETRRSLPLDAWQMVWQGARPGDTQELLTLYKYQGKDAKTDSLANVALNRGADAVSTVNAIKSASTPHPMPAPTPYQTP